MLHACILVYNKPFFLIFIFIYYSFIYLFILNVDVLLNLSQIMTYEDI